jgi:hypothetical protein
VTRDALSLQGLPERRLLGQMDDNLIQAQGEKKLLELEDRQGSSSVNGVLSNGMCFVVDAYENRV